MIINRKATAALATIIIGIAFWAAYGISTLSSADIVMHKIARNEFHGIRSKDMLLQTRGVQDATLSIPPINVTTTDVAKWIFGAAIGLIAVLVGIVWNDHRRRIDVADLKIDALGKSLSENLQDIRDELGGKVSGSIYETNRQEMRDGIIGLHQKIEAYERASQSRHDTVMSELLRISKEK